MLSLLRRWLPPLCIAIYATVAATNEIILDETTYNHDRCLGMYSKSAWGGTVDPFIMITFLPSTVPSDIDPIVSLLIFEWKDLGLIGIPDPDDPSTTIDICQIGYDKQGLCTKDQVGQFILPFNATRKPSGTIITKAVHINRDNHTTYPITATGFYCVYTQPFTASKFEAVVEFRNAYGELPASQIPKLPFFGGMSLLYILVIVFWMFLYVQNRKEILAVQKYITAILVFLVVEMIVTWGYYQAENVHGTYIGSTILLVVVAILNAGRNSFSFFLLLIVCMGYGVVKPTLGRAMIYARVLAIVHFIFGILYSVTSFLLAPESAGPIVLLIVLPLASTLTAFYVWTLNALNATLKDLRERKQNFKESMYKKLWWCILISILVIFAFFFFDSVSFASIDDPNYVPLHWKSRWFLLDGWLNIVFFADVAWIAYVWRPTANNRRLAMSDEIAQDDDGNFEIGDMGAAAYGSDDDDDGDGDEELARPARRYGDLPKPAAATTATAAVPASSMLARPPPAVKSVIRDSLDGETIFAVGDDADKFSDDEDDNGQTHNPAQEFERLVPSP